MPIPLKDFTVEKAFVQILPTYEAAGQAAAEKAAEIIRAAIRQKGHARIIIATGNSQLPVVKHLVKATDLDWGAVEVFHMDEYVGIDARHPASFRLWLRTELADVVQPGAMHYLQGDADDLEAEMRRYAAKLAEGPIDLCFPGFGENGHIAFNDPHVADFSDPLPIKRVVTDDSCRMQQVNEGHFPHLSAVPEEALTLTCPTLLSAKYLVCCVPEARKAEAVRNALEGPISPLCPASVVRTHPLAFIFLDLDSAALLAGKGSMFPQTRCD